MPFYEYKCLACQESFEEFLPMKQRKKPETKPCPKCGEKRVQQTVLLHQMLMQILEWMFTKQKVDLRKQCKE